MPPSLSEGGAMDEEEESPAANVNSRAAAGERARRLVEAIPQRRGASRPEMPVKSSRVEKAWERDPENLGMKLAAKSKAAPTPVGFLASSEAKSKVFAARPKRGSGKPGGGGAVAAARATAPGVLPVDPPVGQTMAKPKAPQQPHIAAAKAAASGGQTTSVTAAASAVAGDDESEYTSYTYTDVEEFEEEEPGVTVATTTTPAAAKVAVNTAGASNDAGGARSVASAGADRGAAAAAAAAAESDEEDEEEEEEEEQVDIASDDGGSDSDEEDDSPTPMEQ